MTSNLIPERRTDKNGRSSIRWVKPDTGSNKTKKSLPAPKADAPLKTPLLDSVLTRANLSALAHVNLDFQGTSSADLDPRTARAVEEFLDAAAKHQNASLRLRAEDMVFGALLEIRDGYGEKHDYADINNVAVFGQALLEGGDIKDRMFMYRQGLYATSAFDTTIHDFLLEATDEEREQATALIRFANEAPEPFSAHYFGYDETSDDDSPEDHADTDDDDYYISVAGKEPYELTRFIKKHHEKIDDIIKVVKERNDADLEMLESVINHDQQAIRSGLL